MRSPIWITLAAALLGLGAVYIVGRALIQPNLPLIAAAGFDDEQITPNADGRDDITTFRYSITRTALVSLSLRGADGREYVFRDQQPRIAGEYSVLFSGVVNGFALPDEEFEGELERRLLPNGEYAWTLTAEARDDEERAQSSGTLTIREADAALPLITDFSISPEIFTPNQDGVDDRVEINVALQKDVDFLRVFLISETGASIPISARRENRPENSAGRHSFDYEGGIDLGADPPPDGTYSVVAIAQDAEGQRLRREGQLTIAVGGKPRAEISSQPVGADVIFTTQAFDSLSAGALVEYPDDPALRAVAPITMQVGDYLIFGLTVENYGPVPIRTTYPPPGTVYEQNQTPAALGPQAFEAAGVWRVGLQCDTSTTSFPYRWALGSPETLEAIEHPRTGEIFYYLPAGERALVWGAVRLTRLEPRNNPQVCWAGLIHEGVEVSLQNSRVGPREVELVDPNASTEP